MRIVDAPRHANMREHDCALCGFEKLQRPVWLEDGGRVFPAGTHCAAVALGLIAPTAKRGAAERAIAAAQRAVAMEAERTARREADEKFAAWKVFLDKAAGPGDVGSQVARLGGFGAARAAFAAKGEEK